MTLGNQLSTSSQTTETVDEGKRGENRLWEELVLCIINAWEKVCSFFRCPMMMMTGYGVQEYRYRSAGLLSVIPDLETRVVRDPIAGRRWDNSVCDIQIAILKIHEKRVVQAFWGNEMDLLKSILNAMPSQQGVDIKTFLLVADQHDCQLIQQHACLSFYHMTKPSHISNRVSLCTPNGRLRWWTTMCVESEKE